MAKRNTYKRKKTGRAKKKKKYEFHVNWSKLRQIDWNFLNDKRFRISLGLGLITFSVLLMLSFISALQSVKADQSIIQSLGSEDLIRSGLRTQNWLGLIGASLSHLFIYKWFGIAAFLLPPLLFSIGTQAAFGRSLFNLAKATKIVMFGLFWISLLLGYLLILGKGGEVSLNFYAGGMGFKLAEIFNSFVGFGTPFILVLSLSIFLLYFFDLKTLLGFTSELQDKMEEVGDFAQNIKKKSTPDEQNQEDTEQHKEDVSEDELMSGVIDKGSHGLIVGDTKLAPVQKQNGELVLESQPKNGLDFEVKDTTDEADETVLPAKETALALTVSKPIEEVVVEDMDEYDPTLDLASFKRPHLDLLRQPSENSKAKVTHEELQENKNKIVKTLNDFKIGIASIKATIGPTVTLYEIVPKAGVKISKIKNLEDDIALSLAALGIRIIAPIPGKGTIGIEVPNKNRQMVNIRSVLASDKFINTDKALPIALGRTISNEIFVTDLAKMPHLLMAGATGQGKSVGLNVILSSLLYKKHPSELKFVLVDPKKVELSIFDKIERHYLAALPDAEDAIITDTSRVVHTLNSLCVEMDVRYNLLKDASARNIKEYNAKFKKRRLNPENGHRFLPYIVLVIDELADLMMVAGKEVEMPIARLAQLARAIGIHLIIATQRPSVNVITGIIKANFPARLSFRVTSKIDSRTILDTNGAEQLVGMGDMLLSNGSEIIRLQCAFVDTDEVERICEYIGEQKSYDTAYLLPEYEDEQADARDIDMSKLDSLFAEAARLIVIHGQGSTSLVQRKLSLGYNRAGRIIDQLEAAGIVGPFSGSKAREVMVQDEMQLEDILRRYVR
ncbi:MAG: DNA translocase FtsK 4TM domain-containing protein [Flammeovirgaceae bacterium]